MFRCTKLIGSNLKFNPKFNPKLNLKSNKRYFSSEQPNNPKIKYDPPPTTPDPKAEAREKKWKDFYDRFYSDYNDLSQELERRKYNKRIIAIILASIFGYATYGFFRNLASKEVVQISSKTFDDPKFKEDAIKLITEVCESQEVQAKITELLKNTVINLTKDPSVQTNITNLLSQALINLTEKPEVQKALGELLKKHNVKFAAEESIKNVVLDLINKEDYKELRDEVTQYLTKEIQKQLNEKKHHDSVYQIMRHSVRKLFWLS